MMETQICTQCGLEKPIEDFYTRSNGKRHGQCISCMRQNQAEYREKNRDKINQQKRDHYDDNKEELNAKSRANWHKNKDKYHVTQKEYRENHPEECKASFDKWYVDHREDRIEKCREYRIENHEAIKAHDKERAKDPKRKEYMKPIYSAKNHRRRASMKDCSEEVDEHIKKLYSADNVCYWCGLPITKEELTVDHIIPLDKGGEHSVENIVPAHRTCNYSKNNKYPWEFIKHMAERERIIDQRFIITERAYQATLF